MNSSGTTIQIQADDGGTFAAYLAPPPAAPGPALVLVQEIFGITDWIRETADMFAAEGYVVAAPDMFWRLEPNFVADHDVPEQRRQGLAYRGEIDHGKGVSDIDALLRHLCGLPACNGRKAVFGFCLGGTFAYLSSTRLEIDKAVSYYGTQIHEFLDEGKNIGCPLMMHMGEHDDAFPVEDRNRIHAALIGIPHVSIYMYDAGHAFCNTHRPSHYVAEEARKAHERTLTFFGSLK